MPNFIWMPPPLLTARYAVFRRVCGGYQPDSRRLNFSVVDLTLTIIRVMGFQAQILTYNERRLEFAHLIKHDHGWIQNKYSHTLEWLIQNHWRNIRRKKLECGWFTWLSISSVPSWANWNVIHFFSKASDIPRLKLRVLVILLTLDAFQLTHGKL